MEYKSGKTNKVADALSRVPQTDKSDPEDYPANTPNNPRILQTTIPRPISQPIIPQIDPQHSIVHKVADALSRVPQIEKSDPEDYPRNTPNNPRILQTTIPRPISQPIIPQTDPQHSIVHKDQNLEPQFSAISIIQPKWLEELKKIYLQDPQLQELFNNYHQGILDQMQYQIRNNLLFYKGRLHLGSLVPFQQGILQQFHCSPLGGHTGVYKTYARLKREFYWPGMRRDMRAFIRSCDTCQRNKEENVHPAGLLQSLPIPSNNWQDISMDFIEGLPPSGGRTVIMVVIDRLSKYAHFLALSHPFTATTVAKVFMDNIFKLYGFPLTIVSDRDPVFTSQFWKGLFRLSGTKLLLSSSYHPQMDGQTEVMNKSLEGYLRCFSGDRPRDWSKWLALAEYAYNTSEHTSTKVSPFEVVYGQPPPRLLPYEPGSTQVQAVEEELKDRHCIHKLVQENLKEAQARMKMFADRKRTDREFEEGDKVYLRLQPYRQMSVAVRRNLKLSPRYYGPYTILQKIGKVAYKLDLPPDSQIFPIFHVSCLKKMIGEQTTPHTELPKITTDGTLEPEPEIVLDRRLVKRGQRAGVEVLIQWKGMNKDDATWVDREELTRRFPNLVAKVF